MEPRQSDLESSAKLPVWLTIKQAYHSFFSNLPKVLRISWLWLILLTALGWAIGTMHAQVIAGLREPGMSGQAPLQFFPTGFPVLLFINYIVGIVAASSMAVAWHRLLLLGEEPGQSGSNVMSGHVWRYTGALLLLGLIFLTAMLLIMLPLIVVGGAAASSGKNPVAGALILIVILMFLVLSQRMLLMLPARAIGRNEMRLGDIWRGTRGNSLRLLGGMILAMAPVSIAAQLILKASGLAPSAAEKDPAAIDAALKSFEASFPMFLAAMTAFGLLAGFLLIGFLSHAFRNIFDATER